MGWIADVCFCDVVTKISGKVKLIVVGGGASGFFCAVNAARMNPSLEVVILERSSKLLAKVSISGGGRCNVTHQSEEVADMLDAYPRGRNFMRKTLHQFSSKDTIAWFQQRGVMLKTEADGRMFPVSDQSQTIIRCLLEEAEKFKVKIVMQTEVKAIEKLATGFAIVCKKEGSDVVREYCDVVCVAAGGQPKVDGFSLVQTLGHHIAIPVPSLFTFNIPDKKLHSLMGVSLTDAQVRIAELKMQERGAMLITHWGISGPSVLRLSSRAARELEALHYQFHCEVNWMPQFHETMMLEQLKGLRSSQKQELGNRNPFGLVSRLWIYLITKAGAEPHQLWQDQSNQILISLARVICRDTYTVSGKTTFKEEFVTAGGVLLNEMNPLTMESRKIEGLYFAGEYMDVDGITGGYNFQHAWSSGWIAAKSISSRE